MIRFSTISFAHSPKERRPYNKWKEQPKKRVIELNVSLIAAMILASIAANVDNISAGMEYSSKGKRISLWEIISLSIVTAFFSSLAVLLGSWLEGKIPSEYVEWIAGILLGFIGIRLSMAERGCDSAILEREGWIFILVLSQNNLPMGLSGGFLGFHPLLFGTTLGGASGFLFWVGARIGIRLQSKISWLHRLGAAVLILNALLLLLQ